MATSPIEDELYEFGPFRLDAREQLLWREGYPIRLKPKVFGTLLILVRNAGHVMDRDELMRTLWPDTFVTEANLSQAIWMLRKALGETEDGPKYIETVPRRGYRFAASATRICREEAAAIQQDQGPKRSAARAWRRAVGGLAISLLLASAAAFYFALARGRREAIKGEFGGPAAAKPRRSVAVLGFKNLSGRAEAAWLSTALREMLSMELAAGEKLRTVSGENIARMRVELSFVEAESLAPDSLARIRRNLGADLAVLGSYVALGEKAGGRIRLDVRIQDTVTGDLVATASGTGTEVELFDLVSGIGARFRQQLGVGELLPSEEATVRASFPSNPEAARLYAEGLAKLRIFDALAARDSLQKAVGAEPEHALAHSALAEAWSVLGYDTRAREEAKKAFELSGNLSREDRLFIEGRYREATSQWDKAIEIYRTLFGFFPDNLEYGLRLAEAQTAARRGKEALAALEMLRALPPPASEDPRIDLTEAAAAESLAEYKRCRAAAAKAAEKGAGLGARLLVARARLQEARALRWLGEPKSATAAAQDAKRIFAEVGDRAGGAEALNLLAILLNLQGQLAQAKAAYEGVLAISREIGNGDLMARALNNVAEILRLQGNLVGARRMYEESLKAMAEIGDRTGGAIVLSNTAELLEQQGDPAGAKRRSEEVLRIGREMGDKHVVGHGLHNIAEALRLQGDLAAAQAMYEEAVGTRRAIGNKAELAETLHGLGSLLAAQGDLAAARKRYEEALALRSELGAKGGVAGTLLALAGLSLEEERLGEAEALSRQAAQEFQQEGRSDSEAAARAVLARCLLDQGKSPEAEDVLNRALALSTTSQSLETRLSVAISAARVRAASARRFEAARSLEAVALEATRAGLVGEQFAARLTLGEIEVRFGPAAAGRARLENLEKEAQARGFRLIGRKAADIRRHDAKR